MKFFSPLKRLILNLKPQYEKILIFEKKVRDFKEIKLDFEVDLLITRDLDSIQSLVGQRENWYYKWAKKRLEEGNYCFAAVKEGLIIGCIWTCIDKVYLPNVDYNLSVKKEVAPLLDGWTNPEFRRKGVYSFVMNSCLKYLNSETNYESVYFFIRPENSKSISIHKKLPIVLYIRLIKLFPFRKHIVDSKNLKVEKFI